MLGGPKASGIQFLGGLAAGFLIKEFPATDNNENVYLRPGAIAVLGHMAKKFNANLGAGLCGGAGVLAYQAYDKEQAKQKQSAPTTQGVFSPDAGSYQPRVNDNGGPHSGYVYADGVYQRVAR